MGTNAALDDDARASVSLERRLRALEAELSEGNAPVCGSFGGAGGVGRRVPSRLSPDCAYVSPYTRVRPGGAGHREPAPVELQYVDLDSDAPTTTVTPPRGARDVVTTTPSPTGARVDASTAPWSTEASTDGWCPTSNAIDSGRRWVQPRGYLMHGMEPTSIRREPPDQGQAGTATPSRSVRLDVLPTTAAADMSMHSDGTPLTAAALHPEGVGASLSGGAGSGANISREGRKPMYNSWKRRRGRSPAAGGAGCSETTPGARSASSSHGAVLNAPRLRGYTVGEHVRIAGRVCDDPSACFRVGERCVVVATGEAGGGGPYLVRNPEGSTAWYPSDRLAGFGDEEAPSADGAVDTSPPRSPDAAPASRRRQLTWAEVCKGAVSASRVALPCGAVGAIPAFEAHDEPTTPACNGLMSPARTAADAASPALATPPRPPLHVPRETPPEPVWAPFSMVCGVGVGAGNVDIDVHTARCRPSGTGNIRLIQPLQLFTSVRVTLRSVSGRMSLGILCTKDGARVPPHDAFLTCSGHHNGEALSHLFPLFPKGATAFIAVHRTAAAVLVRSDTAEGGPCWRVPRDATVAVMFELHARDEVVFECTRFEGDAVSAGVPASPLASAPGGWSAQHSPARRQVRPTVLTQPSQ